MYLSSVRSRPRFSPMVRLWASVLMLLSLAALLPLGNPLTHAQEPTIETPAFVYETIYNGGWLDSGRDVAVDAAGNAYVLAQAYNANNDVLVLKLGPDGTVLWTVSMPGRALDFGTGIEVDGAGGVYITGWTDSDDFPIVNALQATLNGPRDAFLTKLSAQDGSILFSTYLGGSRAEGSNDIVLNSAGEIYLVGYTNSTDFPTMNPLQGQLNTTYCFCDDAFVAKISADGQSILYGTYLGGGFDDSGDSIGVDAGDNIYVTGNTRSDDFPLAAPIQSTYGGGERDLFLSRIAVDGSALQYSTFLGGEDWDLVSRLQIDGAGNAYLTGWTRSVAFPTTAGAFQEQFAGGIRACGSPPFEPLHNCEDAFVTKVLADGSALAYSTFLGGEWVDEARGIAVDGLGQAYIVGYSSSADFPPAGSITPTDIFVSQLSADGSALNYTIGIDSNSANAGHGIAVGSAGDLYVTGAKNVPADVYVARLADSPPPPANALHVANIRLRGSVKEASDLPQVQAVVRIRDQVGQLAPGAEVRVEVTLPNGLSEEMSALTNAKGRVKFWIRSKQPGLWRVCVLDVTREGFTYDPSQNEETCDSIVYPDKADIQP